MISFTLTKVPVPTEEKQSQRMMLPPPCFTMSIVVVVLSHLVSLFSSSIPSLCLICALLFVFYYGPLIHVNLYSAPSQLYIITLACLLDLPVYLTLCLLYSLFCLLFRIMTKRLILVSSIYFYTRLWDMYPSLDLFCE